MQAKRLSASHGWKWVVDGIRLWRKSPMAITMAAMTMTLLVFLTGLVPLLGQVALPVILAPLEVGMFILCSKVDRGQATAPAVLFAGFRRNLPRLVALGVIRLAGNLLFLSIAVAMTGTNTADLSVVVSADGTTTGELMQQYLAMLGWFFVLRIPVEMATWFAPLMIGLRGLPVLKAMFFSFVGCWRSLGALVVFIISLAVLLGVVPSLIVRILSGFAPALGAVVLVPVLVMAMPIFYAAYYRSANDIFSDGF